MKRINNEEILDRIYDLADQAGMRIDRFLEKIEDTFGEKLPDMEGLPQDVADELHYARESKKEARKQTRLQKDEEAKAADIKKFRELFPEVAADDIPDSVWDEVANGESLVNAYALYLAVQQDLNSYAEGVNSRNAKKSARATSDGSAEPVFTKEMVEKMSGSDIKSNYKGILKAMKNWRFN